MGSYVIVITQDGYDILVITEFDAKLRMSVNNKDIIQMYLGYNWLISQKTLPINASFVNSKQWLQVMFTYQSFFLVLTIFSFHFFLG